MRSKASNFRPMLPFLSDTFPIENCPMFLDKRPCTCIPKYEHSIRNCIAFPLFFESNFGSGGISHRIKLASV